MDIREGSQYLTFSKRGGVCNVILLSETANAASLMGWGMLGFGVIWVSWGLGVLVLFFVWAFVVVVCFLVVFFFNGTAVTGQDVVVLTGLSSWYQLPVVALEAGEAEWPGCLCPAGQVRGMS